MWLDPARLADLFADSSVIDDLRALGARVALMCSDSSDGRAAQVGRLNAAGVPVAWIGFQPPQAAFAVVIALALHDPGGQP